MSTAAPASRTGVILIASLALGALAALEARADPPDPMDPDAPTPEVSRCEPWPDASTGKVAVVHRRAEGVLVRVEHGRRAYFAVAGESDLQCPMLVAGKPDSWTSGRFVRGERAMRLEVANVAPTTDSTALAVLFAAGGAARDFVVLPESCNVSVRARKVRLFDDADSVLVQCSGSAGAATREHRFVLHVVGGVLRVVFEGYLGMDVAPTDEERRAGECMPRAVGWLRVERRGKDPALRYLTPADPNQEDGRGIAQVHTWTFDRAAGRFAPAGEGTPTPYDLLAGCRRD